MNTLLIYVIFVIAGFTGMYIAYKPQSDKYSQTLTFSNFMLPLPYIYLLYLSGSLSAYFLFDNQDFIEPLTLWRMVLPLLAAPLIYASGLFLNQQLSTLITIFLIAVTVWIQPLGDGNSYPEMPIWAIRLIVTILACIYCLGALVCNSLPHILIIPQIVTLAGLSVMASLGAVPVYTAMCAAVLIGALCAYLSINFYDVKIEIDNAAATALSYMICSLLLYNLGEMSFPSCAILTTIFWSELIVAVWRRFFIVRSGSLAENTNYWLAAQNYTIKTLSMGILRISCIIMFIAWFQLYAVNTYTLTIIAVGISIWLNNSLSSLNNSRSFKQINRDFVDNIKQNIAQAKDAFNSKNRNK